MFSLICRFWSKTNAVKLLDSGYMVKGEHIQEE
jgi:hypothetical protein